ncbi:MAG: hypothetical protein LUQ22_07625 [Methanotrichaceae archaeon]|nr:hypothetical protein [Methanotrichaceae archaeon]
MAPREHFVTMLNRNLNFQRFKVLYVTGNFSGILTLAAWKVHGAGDPARVHYVPAYDYPRRG